MSSQTEMRGSIKFCVLLGLTPTQTESAYRNTSVSRALVFKWHRRFCEGRTSIEDDERSGRPNTAISEKTVDEVKRLIDGDRIFSINEIVMAMPNDISYGSVQNILTNTLGMLRVCARWIPRLLTSEQKMKRVKIATEFLSGGRQQGDEFFKRIVTIDETWFHMFDPETKQESSVWKSTNSLPPKKARVMKSKAKVMFVVFSDESAVILAHAVPKGQTVTAPYFSQVIRQHLRRALSKKRPELTNVLLHMDNAPSHTAALTTETLQELTTETISHPPYSPDLAIPPAPCDLPSFLD